MKDILEELEKMEKHITELEKKIDFLTKDLKETKLEWRDKKDDGK